MSVARHKPNTKAAELLDELLIITNGNLQKSCPAADWCQSIIDTNPEITAEELFELYTEALNDGRADSSFAFGYLLLNGRYSHSELRIELLKVLNGRQAVRVVRAIEDLTTEEKAVLLERARGLLTERPWLEDLFH